MKQILFIFISFFILSSCTSYKQKEVKNNLESLITDIEKNNSNYTEQDWETKNKEFDIILSKEYLPIKDKLNEEQRLEINRLIGKYEAIKIKSGINRFKGILKDGFQQLESIITELSNDTTLLK
jgi:hypothetical protein